ncbi:MAG TPA: signal protein, partial [Myxococcales bacterium]|nr:signal protein [Myxococcales bacterium]
DVAGGRLKVPEYPLRDGDELKDVFEAVTRMVRGLRDRQEEDVKAVSTMIERAARSKAAMELVPELQSLESKLRQRLD